MNAVCCPAQFKGTHDAHAVSLPCTQQGQGVDLSHGVAPRAARLQFVTSQVIRDGLGEDAAAAVVGADVQDLH